MTWWNVSFPFRRNISVVGSPTGTPVGHPVSVSIDRSKILDANKVLPSYADVVVIYNNVVLPRSVTLTATDFVVNFNTYVALDPNEVDDNYYIYYGNPTPAIVQPAYISNDWPVSVNFSGAGVSFTHPGEDWIEGVSKAKQARATFVFNGTKVRLVSDIGPDKGLAEIQLDAGPWTKVDLYSKQRQPSSVIQSYVDLLPADHILRIRALDAHNAASVSNSINIVRFDYMKYVQVLDLGEEVSDLTWSSSLGGM